MLRHHDICVFILLIFFSFFSIFNIEELLLTNFNNVILLIISILSYNH